MTYIRKAAERGHFQNNWLNSRHSFSFGEYRDPAHMGVSLLRVINDDRVIAGAGFPTHPHNNMEIVSYVLEGELAHKDSIGNGSTIRPGEVQRMSAGTGITHSEFNPSQTEGTRFLQIWLLPDQRNIAPNYAQKYFSAEERQGQLRLLISPDGREGSISANTQALMYGSLLDGEQTVGHSLAADRMAYVHVAQGEVGINGEALSGGDGIAITDEHSVKIIGKQQAEILLFNLPKE